MDKISYALSKRFTQETAEEFGAVKGAPCTIKSIVKENGINTVTFEWTNSSGDTRESTMIVLDGEVGTDGVSITEVKVDADNQLIVTLSDGTSEVAGTITTLKGDKGDPGTGVPDGGTDGQILVRDTTAPTGTKWVNSIPGDSSLTDDLNVSQNVGGIKSGDSYEQGTSLEDILRDMLDPVLYPTLTAPSATLTATGSKLIEKGGSLNTVFTVSFSRGSINPAYGTSGYRSGEATGYALNGGTEQAENTFSETITEATTAYTASVSYAAGEQPKDSKGNDYSTPLAAGSVSSNTINYEFVLPIYANTTNITTIAKLSLISKSAKQRDLDFPAQTVANPEVFDVPADWTLTAVQVKNDLSGAWENASNQFTVTDTTHEDAGGNTVNYKRYTFNLGYGTGARSVRIKWS